jgi:hypothetical protein
MHAGDMWQYVDLGFQDTFVSKVLGDTVLPNGKHYVQFSHAVFPSSFLREAGSKLYAWDQYDSTEYLLFDFALAPNDTVSRRTQFGAQFAIVVIDTGREVSTQRRWWIFADVRVIDSTYSYEFSRWMLSDSIGVTNMTQEPGNVWLLQGAVINGVQIGVIASVSSTTPPRPATAVLYQNYPNPFNPSTTIGYALPRRSNVTLAVFNLLGQEVATLVNGEVEAGYHEVNFTAAPLASGLYVYRLQAAGTLQTRKLLLLR